MKWEIRDENYSPLLGSVFFAFLNSYHGVDLTPVTVVAYQLHQLFKSKTHSTTSFVAVRVEVEKCVHSCSDTMHTSPLVA